VSRATITGMTEATRRALVPVTYADYRDMARRRLPRQLFDYVDGG
jgi:hypothetical protein